MAPHSEIDTLLPATEAAAPAEEAKAVEEKTNGTYINGDSKVEVANGEQEFEIPKTCKAGVVHNPGPDFKVVVEDVPVPEPGVSWPPSHSYVRIEEGNAVANHCVD
jgi:hypothetical protein